MILFWLGFVFVLVMFGAGLVIFPCLALAGRADREMHRSWDDWASQCEEGIAEMGGRIVGGVPGPIASGGSRRGVMQFVVPHSGSFENADSRQSAFNSLN